jgi:hypothetical protein
MIDPKFLFRQFFDFGFGVNASHFNLASRLSQKVKSKRAKAKKHLTAMSILPTHPIPMSLFVPLLEFNRSLKGEPFNSIQPF